MEDEKSDDNVEDGWDDVEQEHLSSQGGSIEEARRDNLTNLENMINGSSTIQDPKNLAGLSARVEREGKIEKMIKRQLRHFWEDAGVISMRKRASEKAANTYDGQRIA